MTQEQENFINDVEADLTKADPYERVGLEPGEEATEARVQHLTAITIEGIEQCLPEGEKRDILLTRVRLAAEQAVFHLQVRANTSLPQNQKVPDPDREDTAHQQDTALDDKLDRHFDNGETPTPKKKPGQRLGREPSLVIAAIILLICVSIFVVIDYTSVSVDYYYGHHHPHKYSGWGASISSIIWEYKIYEIYLFVYCLTFWVVMFARRAASWKTFLLFLSCVIFFIVDRTIIPWWSINRNLSSFVDVFIRNFSEIIILCSLWLFLLRKPKT